MKTLITPLQEAMKGVTKGLKPGENTNFLYDEMSKGVQDMFKNQRMPLTMVRAIEQRLPNGGVGMSHKQLDKEFTKLMAQPGISGNMLETLKDLHDLPINTYRGVFESFEPATAQTLLTPFIFHNLFIVSLIG